jgi:hypothetical protein
LRNKIKIEKSDQAKARPDIDDVLGKYYKKKFYAP